MTARERRSFLVASVLLLLASGGRWAFDARAREPVLPADSMGIVDDLLEDTREAIAEEERRSLPLEEGETLDPNRASEVELDRLPGVGPATAERIVREREEGGAFESVADLERVRGIGAATRERMAPHVEIGPIPMGMRRRADGAAGSALGTRRGSSDPGAVPTVPSSSAESSVDESASAAPAPLDLNRASESELEGLRGIGPVLAERIVAHRSRAGRFRRVDDLVEVRGIGPVTLEALRPFLRVGQ